MSRRGFTLTEVAFTCALLAVAMGSVLSAAGRGKAAFRRTAANTALDTRVARALERMVRELGPGETETLDPALEAPLSSPDVALRAPVGDTDGEVEWSTRLLFRREMEPGELPDGVDNDGDGLVDEGMLVRISDPGGPDERRTILARGVSALLEGELPNGLDDNGNDLIDEAGLCFDLEGDALNVRLSLEAPGPEGEPMTRTLWTRVHPRN